MWILAYMGGPSSPTYTWVSVGAQDASRCSQSFLDEFVASAASMGVDRVRIADTVGIWNPLQTASIMHRLSQLCGPCSLEFHGHNDLGMATANALAALQSGADSISATVTGVGERAGNAALEQVAIAIRHSLAIECGIDCGALQSLCEMVAQATRRPIPINQPITGEAIFRHESGIHCHSLAKNSKSFEAFCASEVGRPPSEFVIGRHSGSEGVLQVLLRLGVHATRSTATRMLPRIRHHAVLKKSALSDDELMHIFRLTMRAECAGAVE